MVGWHPESLAFGHPRAVRLEERRLSFRRSCALLVVGSALRATNRDSFVFGGLMPGQAPLAEFPKLLLKILELLGRGVFQASEDIPSRALSSNQLIELEVYRRRVPVLRGLVNILCLAGELSVGSLTRARVPR